MATVSLPASAPVEAPPVRTHRFTVQQYDRMVALGLLTPEDRVELLEGWIIDKMPQDPPHAIATELTRAVLQVVLPPDWWVRDQKPIAIPDSRPEPDLAVVRGPIRRHQNQHPGPADIALVVEVADSTLDDDRERKGRIYARARIPVYWILNLPGHVLEVYTQPRAGKTPAYRQRQDHGPADAVPLLIDGREIANVPVRDLLPG